MWSVSHDFLPWFLGVYFQRRQSCLMKNLCQIIIRNVQVCYSGFSLSAWAQYRCKVYMSKGLRSLAAAISKVFKKHWWWGFEVEIWGVKTGALSTRQGLGASSLNSRHQRDLQHSQAPFPSVTCLAFQKYALTWLPHRSPRHSWDCQPSSKALLFVSANMRSTVVIPQSQQ